VVSFRPAGPSSVAHRDFDRVLSSVRDLGKRHGEHAPLVPGRGRVGVDGDGQADHPVKRRGTPFDAEIPAPRRLAQGAVMEIDAATRRNLELLRSLSGERQGSLLATIDRTRTGAGARLLAAWLAAPLTAPKDIAARQDMIAAFVADERLRESLRERLRRVPDLERALSSVVGLHSIVPPDAFTADTLGVERAGNGVLIDDGLVLTIGYLITEASSIWLTTSRGTVVAGHPLAYDQASGFGLVQPLGPLGVAALVRGSVGSCEVGDDVIIAGHGGRRHTLKTQIFAKREFAGYWEYLLDEALFTAPAHPQWGGAALIDAFGRLLGIGSLLVRDTTDGTSQVPGNMFVPIDLLKPILADLIAKGRRSEPARPWLGLATEEVQGHLFVTRVSPDGPADKAGIRAGDIVLGVGAESVRNHEEFYRKVWGQGVAGTDIPLKIIQGVELRELSIRSIDRFQYFREKPTY